MTRVVVFIQENKTTDFYFPSLGAWGADVRAQGTPLSAPPDFDQPHDRNAWVHYAMGDYPAVALSIDNDTVIPYYSWLAKTFTFCDHHFGAGTNSTPGHLMTFSGQTPTFKNPPFTGAHPSWDLPTVFRLAERSGRTWGAFPDQDGYPVNLVAELSDASAQPNVHSPGSFATLAHAGTLPDLCYVWSPSGYDEHPPLTPNSPDYIQNGQSLIWRQVDAVIASGEWQQTLFILTWDDWGGYADHVPTPSIETLPDALHPEGFQAVGGARIPLIMFGGAVRQGVESEWHSHASIAKTVIDVLGLPPLGIPQVDSSPSLAARLDTSLTRPVPPSVGSTIVQPSPPTTRPTPAAPSPWPGTLRQPMPPILLNGGATIPAPLDGKVLASPPHLPLGAQSAGSAATGTPRGRAAAASRPGKKTAKTGKKKAVKKTSAKGQTRKSRRS